MGNETYEDQGRHGEGGDPDPFPHAPSPTARHLQEVQADRSGKRQRAGGHAEERGEREQPSRRPSRRPRFAVGHEPQARERKRQQQVEVRVESEQYVVITQRKGIHQSGQNHRRQRPAAAKRARERVADGHDRRCVEDRIGDHLQDDVPIAGDLEDRQGQRSCEENNVLIVSVKQIADRQVALEIGLQQVGRLAVPFVRVGSRVSGVVDDDCPSSDENEEERNKKKYLASAIEKSQKSLSRVHNRARQTPRRCLPSTGPRRKVTR